MAILGVNGIRLIGMRSGVGRAIEAILRCMGELPHPFNDIRVYTPSPIDANVSLPECARNIVTGSTFSPGVWEQWVLPRTHGDCGLLLCPSYVVPLLVKSPTFLIHHGSYEGYPQAFGWWRTNKAKLIFSLSARRATLMSTVSEQSKRDIVRFYGIEPEKIHVVPEGVDTHLFRPIEDPALLSRWRVKIFGCDVPFILYVGKPTKRRNLPALIAAVAALRKEGTLEHKVLLIGTSLPGSGIEDVIEASGVKDDIVAMPFGGHDEIALAYNASSLMVYPSSYEGFGMPVLEAMACGTPVIALDNTAFPEFAGGVAHLLPDACVGTLYEGIRDVLGDDAWRARMAEYGPQRAAQYDWRIITKQYIDLFARVMF